MNKRRDFMKSSAAAATIGTLGFNINSYAANVKSPNDTIRIACVGVKAQGN